MKKIPTMFKRNPDNMRELLDEPHPDCLWVFEGEGVATRKIDGSCCMVKGGKLFKRREIKKGHTPPSSFICEDIDSTTGKSMGWVPVDENDPQDKWHMEAFAIAADIGLPWRDGTYELVGPKVNGNKEKLEDHHLQSHDFTDQYPSCPRTMEGLEEWLAEKDIEGLVFHHPDGRMAKIKKRDFGMTR